MPSMDHLSTDKSCDVRTEALEDASYCLAFGVTEAQWSNNLTFPIEHRPSWYWRENAVPPTIEDFVHDALEWKAFSSDTVLAMLAKHTLTRLFWIAYVLCMMATFVAGSTLSQFVAVSRSPIEVTAVMSPLVYLCLLFPRWAEYVTMRTRVKQRCIRWKKESIPLQRLIDNPSAYGNQGKQVYLSEVSRLEAADRDNHRMRQIRIRDSRGPKASAIRAWERAKKASSAQVNIPTRGRIAKILGTHQ